MLQIKIKPYSIISLEPPPYRLALLVAILSGCFTTFIIFPVETLWPLIAVYDLSTVKRLGKLLIVLLVILAVYRLFMEKYRVRSLLFNTERLETLLKNLPGMAYRCFNSKNWPMDFVSEGCYALCGYKRSEIENQHVLWGMFTHQDDIEAVEKSVLDAVDKGEAFEVEYRIIARGGEEKWVWERGRAVGRMDDEIILEGLITDITDRKLAEQSLMQAEAYSKAVVDTAVEAVVSIDEQGHIETINLAAENMFEYTPEMILGENIRCLISPDYLEEYDQYRSHFQEDHLAHRVGGGCEVMGIRQNGSTFPMHFVVSEILNQPDRKYVGLIRDLSVQREAEREVREQRDQLAHVDRLNTLGEMASAIAHEINQPLTAISMYSQTGLRLLNQKPPQNERCLDVLYKLSIQAHRAGAIIEHSQRFSRQNESHREEVDCNVLLREVHKLAEVEARIRDIVIILQLAGLLPMVVCDPVQIQQVVLNLLRNGMESMKEAGYKRGNRIVVQTHRSDIGVKISVIDSGTGITADVAEQLYRPFSTTKDTGTGIGLSISRTIIRAHGAQLKFLNNENGGVTFYFTLPYTTYKKHD